MRGVWTGVAAAVVAAVLAGCSQEQERLPTAGSEAPEAAEAEGGAGVGGGGGTTGQVETSALPQVGPSIIKTASLDVEVARDGFGEALDAATGVAARHGGFVVSTTTAGEDARRGSLMIRVPAERFEQALVDLRALGRVEAERTEGRDVSQEFVDLEARLRNLEAQETVLLRLFDEAASVADTIRIQQELSGVQLQTEEIEGRLRFLRDQSSLATISLSLGEEGATAPGVLRRAWQEAVDGFVVVLAGAVIFMGYVLPFALAGAAALLLYRGLRTAPSA
jgi:hypothetical protein